MVLARFQYFSPYGDSYDCFLHYCLLGCLQAFIYKVPTILILTQSILMGSLVTLKYCRLSLKETKLIYKKNLDSSFCEHVNKHHPKEILSLDEFLKVRTEVVASRNANAGEGDAAEGREGSAAKETDLPPGESDEKPPGTEDTPESEAPPGVDAPPGTATKSSVEVREKLQNSALRKCNAQKM